MPELRINHLSHQINIYCILLFAIVMCFCCKTSNELSSPSKNEEVRFNSSNKELVSAFEWAKKKALSFAHDGTDPVGYWYEAALPNREAFCMRDVSHQSIGAEILGLSKHNYNMLLKFAQNISEEKDYCTYWEINRYDKPAPVDYENDNDFWYNLPSNFDLTFSAYRLFQWTGNEDYLDNPELKRFYDLSLNEYTKHWELSFDEIRTRNRSMHLSDLLDSRFGNKRGIPTYNEGGKGETLIGIDMTASLIAALEAYSEMLRINGEISESKKYLLKAKKEHSFLDEFWWDDTRKEYRTILYEDESFDHFMVGDDQAFLHYLIYFEALTDEKKIKKVVEKYEANFHKLIVELKSYLPIIFYENGKSDLANKMIIDLCSINNHRRDYPENSYTVIEHMTRGLMGVNVNAESNSFSTISRLTEDEEWAELTNIPLLNNKISVKHSGLTKSTASNESGKSVNWIAQFQGSYEHLYINGAKTKCNTATKNGIIYSYHNISLNKEAKAIVTTGS